MSFLRPFASALAAVLLTAVAARAGDIASVESPSGVEVQASIEGDGRLALVIVPSRDVRLNGRLGVSFEAQDGGDAWGESLPRLVLGEGDYFADPVFETVHFAPDELGEPARLMMTFGSCLPVTNICVLEETLVTLVAATDGGVEVTVAAIEP